jgi:glycosyltransferase involved in cell wall biosynthesis
MDLDRFEVTYNGLEFDLLEPERGADQVRAELGVQPSDFVVGTSAQLRAWKRIDRLLLALADLDRPDLCLVIVGDGPDRSRLEELAETLGVSARTVFTGTQLHVGDYLQVMNAFCLPSTSLESFGNAAVEAMAMGIPSIVFADSSAMREHIENGATGLIATDQPDLERLLLLLIQDRELGRRLGAAGRESIRRRYTPEQAARRYRRLYAAALDA